MSEPEVNALCLMLAGLGALICLVVARHYRKQDEADEARRAEIHRYVEQQLRTPK